MKYRFINEHRTQHAISLMCRLLRVARAGFYAWLYDPISTHEQEDGRLLEAGECCGKHRVARIMRKHKIKAVRGYKAPWHITSRPSIIAPNHLQRQFTVDAPDKAWVTDITYIRTWQGWLYLVAVVTCTHARWWADL